MKESFINVIKKFRRKNSNKFLFLKRKRTNLTPLISLSSSFLKENNKKMIDFFLKKTNHYPKIK